MSEHNETPWYANGPSVYMGADGGFSLRCCPNPEANAKHIVHCVNNHEKLVSMLTEIAETEDDGIIEVLGVDYCERLSTLLTALEAEKGGEL